MPIWGPDPTPIDTKLALRREKPSTATGLDHSVGG